MFKKDNYILGFLLGVLTPPLFYGFLYLTEKILIKTVGYGMVREPHYLILLAVIPNVFLLRYYIGRLKFTKTGLVLLLTTMVFIILYFLKFYQNPQ